MDAYALRSRTLAPDRDLCGIPSKSPNILLDPVERQSLVSIPQIRSPSRCRLFPAKKSKPRKSILDTDSDHGIVHLYAILDYETEIVAWVVRAAIEESAAMNPYCDGEFRVG